MAAGKMLETSFPNLHRDYPTHKLCWFKVGGHAQYYFKPENTHELQQFIIEFRRLHPKLAIIPIGAGSNLIIRDEGVAGAIIRLGREFNYIHIEDDIVIAGGGTLDLNVALFTRENQVVGLEFMAGIPGTIGGAIAMNAGAYGREIKDCLIKAQAINLQTGEVREFTNAELRFKYRSSSLGPQWLFLEGQFAVEPGNVQEIAQKIQHIQDERTKTQPIKTKTGGSTFKNPIPHKAWELIDAAGLRGHRHGGCVISPLHCNFIINDEGATAQDIIELIEYVRDRVFQNSGITLETEIKII